MRGKNGRVKRMVRVLEPGGGEFGHWKNDSGSPGREVDQFGVYLTKIQVRDSRGNGLLHAAEGFARATSGMRVDKRQIVVVHSLGLYDYCVLAREPA
jgi:hypothetical protein